MPVTMPMELHRLHGCIFPESDAAAQKIEAFGNSLVILIDREHPDESLLLQEADGAHSAYRRRAN